MMQKLWNYLIKKFNDEIGVRKYLKDVFANFGQFIAIALIALTVASLFSR